MRGGGGLREQALDWGKTIFLHTGWAGKYDGTQAPKGGHAYLQAAVGVEAANFMPDRGWRWLCSGFKDEQGPKAFQDSRSRSHA